MKYSSLSQITSDNVDQLELVWTWATGDAPIPAAKVPFRNAAIEPGKFQGTPLMVNGTLFIATSYTQVVALEPETGDELWRYDPRAYEWGMLPRGCGFCHRGVAVWTDGDDVRVFINTRWRLIALDGRTGEPIGSFGHRGEIDLTEGLVWERDNDTTAAVTGAVLGAYVGADALPESWVQTTLERNRAIGLDLEKLTDRLVAAIERRR